MYVYGASRRRAAQPKPPPPPSPAPPAPRPCLTPFSAHPAPPAANAEHLPWHTADGDRLRILHWTCEQCRDDAYEYGLIGGAYRIRRTVRRGGSIWTVHETPVVRQNLALAWWAGLLSGRVV